jgi:hypothetical protein
MARDVMDSSENSGTEPEPMHDSAVRLALFIALLAAAPCGAQDLPDPGRRLSQEEQNADPDKPRASEKAKPTDTRHGERPRDAQACEHSRVRYQLYCGAPNSHRSRSMDCAEAYALYRQNC